MYSNIVTINISTMCADTSLVNGMELLLLKQNKTYNRVEVKCRSIRKVEVIGRKYIIIVWSFHYYKSVFLEAGFVLKWWLCHIQAFTNYLKNTTNILRIMLVNHTVRDGACMNMQSPTQTMANYFRVRSFIKSTGHIALNSHYIWM